MIFWSFVDNQYLTHNMILCMLGIIQFSMKTVSLKSLDTLVHELTFHDFILHLVHTQKSRKCSLNSVSCIILCIFTLKNNKFFGKSIIFGRKNNIWCKIFKQCFLYNIMKTPSSFHMCNPHRICISLTDLTCPSYRDSL